MSSVPCRTSFLFRVMLSPFHRRLGEYSLPGGVVQEGERREDYVARDDGVGAIPSSAGGVMLQLVPDSGAARQRQKIVDAALDKLIDETIVDCYNESEQVTGLYAMLEENL